MTRATELNTRFITRSSLGFGSLLSWRIIICPQFRKRAIGVTKNRIYVQMIDDKIRPIHSYHLKGMWNSILSLSAAEL
jgi:hypothetical protein